MATITNLFGDLANDFSVKSLIQRLSKFSFDTSSQLRTVTSGSVSVSGSLSTVSTVTTVNTVTNASMSIGDMGKPASVILQSAQGFYGSVGANFIRS